MKPHSVMVCGLRITDLHGQSVRRVLADAGRGAPFDRAPDEREDDGFNSDVSSRERLHELVDDFIPVEDVDGATRRGPMDGEHGGSDCCTDSGGQVEVSGFKVVVVQGGGG